MVFPRPLPVALAVMLTLVGVHATVRAQGGEDDPLQSRTLFERVGGEVGFASVWQTGAYNARCATFDKGARLNPIIALAYDTPFGSMLRFEVLAGYQGYSLSSSYPEREMEVVSVVTKTGDTAQARVNVDFEHVGTASFGSLFVLPSFKFYPVKWLYLGGGINAGMLFGGTSQDTKNIASKVLPIEGYGLTEVSFPSSESTDPYSKVYPEDKIPTANSVLVSAVGYLGAEFPLNRRLKIGPRLLYQVPLTPAVKEPELKLNAFTFLIGLRLDLR